MVAINPVTNKAYVSLHGEGKVAVIDGAGGVTKVDLYSSGPYGIAVDTVRNLVYVVTIDTYRIVAIDGNTDKFLGWAEIRRMPGAEPVPLRMVAVNPLIGTSGHIFVTTTAGDGGWNKVLMLPKGWPEYFARAYGLVLAEPQEGIAFEPASLRVFVTSRSSDLVAAYLDGEPACPTNFLAGALGKSLQPEDYQIRVCVAGPDGSCTKTIIY
jgi:DNA-binding beta-propeller fold protein YncE